MKHININFKLFFKYILLNINQITIKFINNKNKKTLISINFTSFYYTILHIKLSSLFHSTQLLDIFVYELPLNKNTISDKGLKRENNGSLVYNFHHVHNNQRFFIFVKISEMRQLNKIKIKSVTELFLNANWLERESSELNGIFFLGKKDTRNLLLQYGDTSSPMKKTFPVIGLREIFYDSVSDSLIQTQVSIQF